MISSPKSIRVALPVAAVALALLGGCAVAPPSGPSIVALPRSGEPLDQFQQDDYTCRDYAYRSTNATGASQAATTNSVNSAAIGTLGGAAVGALIGAAAGNAGAGAAIGAGSGLLVGGAAGANGAQYAGGSLQAQYDAAYAQCMTSKGNTISQPQVPVYVPQPVYAPQPVYVAPPPRYYGPPPVMYSPYPYY
ncbi:OmpA family protein [Paraburkholderia sp. BL6665CI2N2]|uniref:YMGG-like glycine zipper-containing protein n=1 Tax=unclassified Paraburkholderia TaxID=2615204 RepID=UPI000D061885|nr:MULTISPECIES: YMGG-like glycine zipper-containing protein [unclassified Paraburkholderia]PRY03926.1 OmpA family protein [Paraburkholderia sp. BL25I1N1]TDY24044.1 OmpA family protein [Paraburkholderia sp. BL6665CI2N2]